MLAGDVLTDNQRGAEASGPPHRLRCVLPCRLLGCVRAAEGGGAAAEHVPGGPHAPAMHERRCAADGRHLCHRR